MLFWHRDRPSVAPAWPAGGVTNVTLPDPAGAVTGALVEAGDAAELLAAVCTALHATATGDSDGETVRLGDSVRCWSVAAWILLELIARNRFVPVAGETPRPRAVTLRWMPLLDRTGDRLRRTQLIRCLPPAAVCGAATPAEALHAFWSDAADSLVRRAAPAVQTPAGWECDLVENLGTPPGIPWDADTERIHDEILAWLVPPSFTETWVGIVELVPPAGSAGGTTWTLVFYVQSEEDPTRRLSADEVRAHGTPPQRAALADAVAAAARFTHTPDPGETDAGAVGAAQRLDLDDTWAYLATLGRGPAGVRFETSASMRRAGTGRLRLRLEAGAPDAAAQERNGVPPRPGDDLLRFLEEQQLTWNITLEGKTLPQVTVDALLAAKVPLLQMDGEWIAFDELEFRRLRRELESGPPSLAPGEVVAAILAGELVLDDVLTVEVAARGALARLATVLRGQELRERPTPAALDGELRHYQARGLDWLLWLRDNHLGGCLADDMGLGKTVQAIALMLEDPGPTLVVAPTSVLGNWEREIRRFGPSLRPERHYGPDRAMSAATLEAGLDDHIVVVTTYAILRRDAALLAEVAWHRVVLDEAQHVKNPASETARAARRIGTSAAQRVAMTGTPVENNLTELWSILDFCNPGLLGTETSFRRRFALPIERFGDAGSATRLRRMTAPFVLRRKKSDPSIISDLPEKHETTLYCDLTPEQATLYKATVDETLALIRSSAGMRRRGLVLTLLTRLKQVCDHPDLVLRTSRPATANVEDHSGKLAHLLDVLEDVRMAGDKSLVFTQYVQMGQILSAALDDAPFLHGGLSLRRREELVQAFQEDPDGPDVFVMSLRAGGLGLNLTAATRVFHYDRWWNPAVEDQATDRTYRIGQTRDVWVHRMVCLGTVEERIDSLLARKRNLADRVIGEGEAWLTELSDAELAALVALEESGV